MLFNNLKNQEIQSLNNIKKAYTNIQQLHKQPEFQNLIQFLHILYPIYNQELQRDIHTPDKINDLTFDAIKNQSQKILLKNQILKQKIINIKDKLFEHQSLSQPFNTHHSNQEKQYIDSIKTISSQIKSKILALKQKRYLNKQAQNRDQSNLARRSVPKPSQKIISPALVQIQQMKRGTEFLTRSIMATKYDMEATEKLVKVDNVLKKNR